MVIVAVGRAACTAAQSPCWSALTLALSLPGELRAGLPASLLAPRPVNEELRKCRRLLPTHPEALGLEIAAGSSAYVV